MAKLKTTTLIGVQGNRFLSDVNDIKCLIYKMIVARASFIVNYFSVVRFLYTLGRTTPKTSYCANINPINNNGIGLVWLSLKFIWFIWYTGHS